MKILQIYPSYLSDVAALPWEIKKSHFFNVEQINTTRSPPKLYISVTSRCSIETAGSIKLIFARKQPSTDPRLLQGNSGISKQ